MTPLLGLPAVAAVAAGIVAWNWSRYSRVALAARLLAATLLLTCFSVVTAAAVYAIAWMVPAEHAIWCRRMLGHSADHRPVAGLILLVIVVGAVGRAGWMIARASRAWRIESLGRTALDIEESDEVYAFAVPGGLLRRSAHGNVVVSTAMLQLLSEIERSALVAHEHAHLRLHHHRYLLVGRVVAAVVPPLRPMTNRLDWLVERWADESAATAISDRAAVATAIARAALATDKRPADMLSFGADSTVSRVEALLRPIPASCLGADLILGASWLCAIVAAAAEVHHLVGVIQSMA
jgi:Zn-dependent protease with chaperone function